MRSKPVYALEPVADDLLSGIAHYESWRHDGRVHFLRKYDETISWIGWNPDLFPKVLGAVQRAILKDSYYLVYFIQEKDRTLVLAVLDGRQNPSSQGALIRKRIRKRR